MRLLRSLIFFLCMSCSSERAPLLVESTDANRASVSNHTFLTPPLHSPFVTGRPITTEEIADYYLRFLGRLPTEGNDSGVDYWKAFHRRSNRIEVQAGILASEEFYVSRCGAAPRIYVSEVYRIVVGRPAGEDLYSLIGDGDVIRRVAVARSALMEVETLLPQVGFDHDLAERLAWSTPSEIERTLDDLAQGIPVAEDHCEKSGLEEIADFPVREGRGLGASFATGSSSRELVVLFDNDQSWHPVGLLFDYRNRRWERGFTSLEAANGRTHFLAIHVANGEYGLARFDLRFREWETVAPYPGGRITHRPHVIPNEDFTSAYQNNDFFYSLYLGQWFPGQPSPTAMATWTPRWRRLLKLDRYYSTSPTRLWPWNESSAGAIPHKVFKLSQSTTDLSLEVFDLRTNTSSRRRICKLGDPICYDIEVSECNSPGCPREGIIYERGGDLLLRRIYPPVGWYVLRKNSETLEPLPFGQQMQLLDRNQYGYFFHSGGKLLRYCP